MDVGLIEYARFEEFPTCDHLAEAERLFRCRHEPQLNDFIEELRRLAIECGSGARLHQESHRKDSTAVFELRAALRQAKDTFVSVGEVNAKVTAELEAARDSLSNLEGETQRLKETKRLFGEEFKKRHKAFLRAKEFYKRLDTVHDVELSEDGRVKVTVRFGNNTVTYLKTDEKYTLVETNPSLENFDELKRRLEETSDLPGLMCCVRRSFINLHFKKRNCR